MFLILCGQVRASTVLWSIGQKDQTSADLALGADHPDQGFTQRFPQDPLFIVGQSDPAKDWPAIQPGPQDGWAGSRVHTFTIAFGLAAVPTADCTLVIDLVEAHASNPPKFVITVNNHPLPVQSPAPGNGDDTMANHPEKGKHQSLSFTVPAEDLQGNGNLIAIRTEDGSWILYDAIHFEAPDGTTTGNLSGVVLGTVTTDDTLTGTADAPKQILRVPITSFTSASTNSTVSGTLTTGDNITQQVDIKPGIQTVDLAVPAVTQKARATVSLAVDGKTYTSDEVERHPMRNWTVYILAHSHHDLGYTDVQPHIQVKQMHNYDIALEQIDKTKDYPPDSKYVWNAEVLWSLDDYLNHFPANAPKIYSAIQAGSLYPNAWYANELTGLCRPEELLRLSTFGEQLAAKTGTPSDSMMISDVPSMTWGCIQALNEAGVRYLSNGPNPYDRIGYTLVATEDKPFYWVSPSGHNKVLYWVSWGGYALAPGLGSLSQAKAQERLLSHLQQLDAQHYPYDITYIRWDGFGDNAAPDDTLAPFVKDWNATHLSPHFIIASTSTAFHALEDKYGKDIPTMKGEPTPYWEDGSGSSAHETSLNREAAEQLVQAETLYAMLKPQNVPTSTFYDAWRDVIMYDEHTWGAYDSISNPTRPGVVEQWKFKQAFAVNGNRESADLINSATADRGTAVANQFDVFNTSSWPRTEVVTLSRDESSAGDAVTDAAGRRVPSQRLSTGELAFLARDVPAFAASRYTLGPGRPTALPGSLQAGNLTLTNSLLSLKIDPKSGGITKWTNQDHPDNLIDNSKARLNDYVYALGGGLDHLNYPDAPTVTVKESGPLVASLLVQGNAPGTKSLSREVRIYRDSPRIDIIDTLDKTDVLDIEAGHIAFPFNLPDGQVRIDSQFAVTRPELDQIAGANKNWFSASRWVDVSNDQYGVTLATEDAPLMEVGGITATLVRSQGDPNVFRKKVDPTQTLYSWIFNNHWETNYKASQSGLLTYRYALQAHHAFDALAATRFGTELSQPLRVFPAAGASIPRPRLAIEPNNLLVTAFKSSDDGKAWIVRLYNPSDAPVGGRIKWSSPVPSQLWKSDMSEKPLQKISGDVTVPAWSLLTVRADF